MSHDVTKRFGIFKPADYVRNAKVNNLDEVGFSDHFIIEKRGHIDYSISLEELTKYIKILREFRKETDFPVKIGIEMDFLSGFAKKIKKVIDSYPFDYAIGSVHFIGNWSVDVPSDIAEYNKWNIKKLYETYFGLVMQAAESRLFNTIGHIDLIKIFGFKPKENISELFKDVAETLKKNNVCVEINTGGLDRPCKEIYPSKELLKSCFEEGVDVTLGSDTHKPEGVGRNFDKAIELLREIGYKEIAMFTKRKKKLVKF
jgi:histidinol-phosphatase (PHP family)